MATHGMAADPCPRRGAAASAGAAACGLCEQGAFATGSAAQACQACGDGKYQTSAGMSSCLNYDFVDLCLGQGPGCFPYADPRSGIASGTLCCFTGDAAP